MEKLNKKDALRYSIRIAGSVTSISLRRNLVSLWLTLNTDEILKFNSNIQDSLNGKIMDFVYKCLNSWNENNGKGFSEFVSERMIEDILDNEDFERYCKISAYI